MPNVLRAIGLMSGTSADGIDAALIQTDGEEIYLRGSHLTEPYVEAMRTRIHAAMRGEGDILMLEQELTLLHAEIVRKLLIKAQLKPIDVTVIGFHGQTLFHRPEIGITHQIGNGALLAEKTGINVVTDFRRRDVAAGGEGAPLIPLFHAALGRELELPLAVVNIGGIANVTWVGRSEHNVRSLLSHDILAFDTGPGNVLLDEWVRRHTGQPYDEDGKLALAGKIHRDIVAGYLGDAYFRKIPPKSLDRHAFSLRPVEGLSLEDGAATLAQVTAETIATASTHFPAPVNRWLVSGGGRRNPAVMTALAECILGEPMRLSRSEAIAPPSFLTRHAGGIVEPVEAVGWEGDVMEAQGFAFLAVRAMRQLPLSLPTTTGVNRPVTGGAFYPA